MLLLLWLLFCVAHLAVELPPKPLSVGPEPTCQRLSRYRAKTRWLPCAITSRADVPKTRPVSGTITNGFGLSQGRHNNGAFN